VRDWGPPFHGEDAAYFVGIHCNKHSIGLDANVTLYIGALPSIHRQT
jgi:hypothetical protein